jgi:hypothetical protein
MLLFAFTSAFSSVPGMPQLTDHQWQIPLRSPVLLQLVLVLPLVLLLAVSLVAWLLVVLP